MFHPNFVTFTNTDIIARSPLGGEFKGNQNAGFTYATFADGSGGLIKTLKDWTGNKTGRLYRAEILTAQEYLTARVGKAMNAPIRDCLVIESNKVIMPFIIGENLEQAGKEMPVGTPQATVLALLDYLVANADRRPKNVMQTKDKRIVGIDHALCNFRPRTASPELVSQLWNGGVTHESLLILHPKLQNLAIDFHQLGMGDKHETMMTNLSQLIKAFQILSQYAVITKGDKPGHEFHGNQWRGGIQDFQRADIDEDTITQSTELIANTVPYTYEAGHFGKEPDPTDNALRNYWNPYGMGFDKGFNTDLGSGKINQALWNGKVSPELQESIDLIRGAIESSETTQAVTVFRGTIPPAQPPAVGSVVENKGFTSTTVLEQVGKNFGGDLWEIHLPEGSNAVGILPTADEYGDVSSEGEIILHDNASFRVDGIRKDGNQTVYSMTYLGHNQITKGDLPGHAFHGNQWTTTGTSDFFGKTFHHADYTTKDGTVLHATAMPHVDGGTFAQVEGEKNGFVISNTNTDFGGGQGYYRVTASDADGNTVGHLDYVIADGEKTPHIQMVETNPSAKGAGLATAMYHVLAANHPNTTPDPGLLTDDGAKWWNSPQMEQAKAEATTYAEYKPITKGDLPGHPFRGNQWRDGVGGGSAVPKNPRGSLVAAKAADEVRFSDRFVSAQEATNTLINQGQSYWGLADEEERGRQKAAIAKDIAARLGDKFDDQLFTSWNENGKEMFAIPSALTNIVSVDWKPDDAIESREEAREMGVSLLVAEWAVTSNDKSPMSLAMQEAAKQEFGLKDTADWEVRQSIKDETNAAYDQNGDLYRAFLRAQYENTQEYLAKGGITELGLYRGVKSDSVFDPALTTLRPLSAWSYRIETAMDFAQTGFVLASTVPADRVLSCARTGIGCLGEAEVVVLGGGKDNIANVDLNFNKIVDLGSEVYEMKSGGDYSGVNFDTTSIKYAYLPDANFSNATLSGDLRSTNFTNANFTNADLSSAEFVSANLSDTNLTGADLSYAKFEGAKLQGADLTNARLLETDLWRADLTNADLTNATLTGADLRDTDLTNANLTGTNLTEVKGNELTILPPTHKVVDGFVVKA